MVNGSIDAQQQLWYFPFRWQTANTNQKRLQMKKQATESKLERSQQFRVGPFSDDVLVDRVKVIVERQYPSHEQLAMFPSGDVRWYRDRIAALDALKSWQRTITMPNSACIMVIEWRS